jgi:tetratricopeptide (TPR) repeat protein
MRQALVALAALVMSAAPLAAQSDETLIVESLRHTAGDLLHNEQSVARAGRLVAVADYLRSLETDDPQVLRFLADLDQTRSEFDSAAALAKRVHRTLPESHVDAMRWLSLELRTRQQADERARWLKGLLDTPELPAAFRSVVAAELADIFLGQGARSDARGMLEEALKLDPLNDRALLTRLKISENPSAELQVETMLSLIRGNPRAWWIVRELANELGRLGLHKSALQAHINAWRIWRGDRSLSEAPPEFAAELFSAMLDFGQAEKALKYFEPAKSRLVEDPQVAALFIEAYRATGQDAEAEQTAEKLETYYRRRKETAVSYREARGASAGEGERQSAVTAILDYAWFMLLSAKRPLKTYQLVDEAEALGADGPAVKLLRAAASLSQDPAKASAQLEGMMDEYPLAAAMLAGYAFEQGDETTARKALEAGFKADRTALAYRMLARLAEANDIKIPPVPQAAEVKKLVEGFDTQIFEIGAQPQNYLQFTTRLHGGDTLAPGQAIYLRVTLRNVSDRTLPIGEWGLVAPRLGVYVQSADAEERFDSLPMVLLPSPKYLPPGGEVSGFAMIDVAALARWLAENFPQQQDLRIGVLPSPYEQQGRLQSASPMLAPEPLKGIRLAFGADRPLEQFEGEAKPSELYTQGIGVIDRVLQSGDRIQKYIVARQVGMALTWLRMSETGQIRLPIALSNVARKDVLLSQLGRALRDPDAVVRAEAVTALRYADLDAQILNQLGAVIEDPSPLVRFRVVELIGASGTRGREKMVKFYSNDEDPRVRSMAEAFLRSGDDDDEQTTSSSSGQAPSSSPTPREAAPSAG